MDIFVLNQHRSFVITKTLRVVYEGSVVGFRRTKGGSIFVKMTGLDFSINKKFGNVDSHI